jgi:hypothetical protein
MISLQIRTILSALGATLLAACAAASSADEAAGSESALKSTCVFGQAFDAASGKVGQTDASPLSPFTPATRLTAVQERRLLETVQEVAPAATAAEAFELAGGRIDRTALQDNEGLRSFTAYTFRHAGSIHGAIFPVGQEEVVARIRAGSVEQCNAAPARCIFPPNYSDEEMTKAGFERTDYRDIDGDTLIDNEDNVEASKTARAVIETAKLLSDREFDSARAAAREVGPFSATRFERQGREFVAIEQDGEVYGAIFEVGQTGPIKLTARFNDTEVSSCSAFEAPGRGEGESCILGARSSVCGAPDMECGSGLECDTNGADHVCARGRCRPRR